jgi:hypothetical protein
MGAVNSLDAPRKRAEPISFTTVPGLGAADDLWSGNELHDTKGNCNFDPLLVEYYLESTWFLGLCRFTYLLFLE